MPLNETHHALLHAAVSREDRLLTMPEGLKPRAAKALVKALIGSGCAVEVSVAADQPNWGEVAGKPIGLQVTSAGLTEIGIEPEGSNQPADTPSPDQEYDAHPAEPARQLFRSHTKLARVVELLQRTQGATLDDLIEATGWLPHSARAALTGLRKRGYRLDRDRNEQGETCYRLMVSEAPSTGDATAAPGNG